MSDTARVVPVSKPRPRRKWLKWIVLGAIGVLMNLTLIGQVGRAVFLHVAEERMEAVVAEIEVVDPDWRWDDIQAAREKIPDEQNSALQVLAAAALLPKDWPNKPATPPKKPQGELEFPSPNGLPPTEETLPGRLNRVESCDLLDEELAADIRAELKVLAPALAKARRLVDLPRGRYEVEWKKNLMHTLVPHLNRARSMATLLQLDAALIAQEGKLDQAFPSAQCILNAGRSVGDEPTLISQLVRMECDQLAIFNIERVLAQGEVSSGNLEAAQRQLQGEEIEPLLSIAFRGERAAINRLFDHLASGELILDQLERPNPPSPGLYDRLKNWLYVRPLCRYNQAVYLEQMTTVVELAKASRAEQVEGFFEFNEEVKEMRISPSRTETVALLFLPAVDKLADAFHRLQAYLRCARVAMAVERYRLAQGHWPEALAQLTPGFLSAVPEDPFASGPLLYRPFEKGVVIYSVGFDGKDDGGTLDRGAKPSTLGVDLGFRLWDVKHRRQAPANRVEDGLPD